MILYGALSAEPTVVPPFQVFARDLTIRGFAFPAVVRNDERLEAVKQFVSEGISAMRSCRQSAADSHLTKSSKAHPVSRIRQPVRKNCCSV